MREGGVRGMLLRSSEEKDETNVTANGYGAKDNILTTDEDEEYSGVLGYSKRV
jgi:hypothetical protein